MHDRLTDALWKGIFPAIKTLELPVAKAVMRTGLRNTAKNVLRDQRRHWEGNLKQISSRAKDLTASTRQYKEILKLQQTLEELPDAQRDVMKLYGQTQAEIGEALGKCRQTIAKLQTAALATLKEKVQSKLTPPRGEGVIQVKKEKK